MRKRIKGLAALIMILCMTIGMVMTTAASETYTYQGAMYDLIFEEGAVVYSGDSITAGGSSGEQFLPIDGSGNILSDEGSGALSDGYGTSLDQKAFDNEDVYTFPANAAGYYGFYVVDVGAETGESYGIGFTSEGTPHTIVNAVSTASGVIHILTVKERPITLNFSLNLNYTGSAGAVNKS